MEIQVFGVRGLPLIRQGDDLPGMICERVAFEDGDILTVASSVYSKAKGFTRDLESIVPGADAVRIAAKTGETALCAGGAGLSAAILLEDPFILSELPLATSVCGPASTTATSRMAG